MAALGASRNTPEWNGASGRRYHWGLVPVEASTSIYVGSMVALNNNGRAVPAQSRASGATKSKLNVIGICEYVYAGGIIAPGLDALNQTGNGALYPGATGTLGNAGAISIGVVCGVFGMDVDSTISDTSHVGQMVVAVDDHTVGLGTLVANTTSITVPAAAPLINVLKPDIVQGTFDAYSATGGGGTHYLEGADFAVDYQAGLFMALAGGAISGGGTVYVTYYSTAAKVVAGQMVAFDGGLAYINFDRSAADL
jgi:hypothetical protein